MKRWQVTAHRALGIATSALGIHYIRWRFAHSLNPDALWIAVPLASAEAIIGLLGTLLAVFVLWQPTTRPPKAGRKEQSVDVFVTCYDEPFEVIERTLLAAVEIRHPHTTWLLDDGRRPDRRELCRRLQCGYLTRADNRHAKAGNLNEAFDRTQGEFILILDADTIPAPDILDATLGYFREPKMAFVQVPQLYYNIPEDDPFGNDARYFYGPIQEGKDGWNSCFSCGAGSIFRRSALQAVAPPNSRGEEGPFVTSTVTEDFATSAVLHSAGFRSAFVNWPCLFGLSPNDLAGVVAQRSRWALGTFQTFFQGYLFRPRLTPAQRLSYFSTAFHYFAMCLIPVFLAAPLIYLLTGVWAIRADPWELMARFLPYYGLHLVMFAVSSWGLPSWRGRQNYVAHFWLTLGALLTAITGRKARFKVTPKVTCSGVYLRFAWPHLLVILLSIFAIPLGVYMVWALPPTEIRWALGVNIGWVVVNFSLIGNFVRTAWWRPGLAETDGAFTERFAKIVAQYRNSLHTKGQSRA